MSASLDFPDEYLSFNYRFLILATVAAWWRPAHPLTDAWIFTTSFCNFAAVAAQRRPARPLTNGWIFMMATRFSAAAFFAIRFQLFLLSYCFHVYSLPLHLALSSWLELVSIWLSNHVSSGGSFSGGLIFGGSPSLELNLFFSCSCGFSLFEFITDGFPYWTITVCPAPHKCLYQCGSGGFYGNDSVSLIGGGLGLGSSLLSLIGNNSFFGFICSGLGLGSILVGSIGGGLGIGSSLLGIIGIGFLAFLTVAFISLAHLMITYGPIASLAASAACYFYWQRIQFLLIYLLFDSVPPPLFLTAINFAAAAL